MPKFLKRVVKTGKTYKLPRAVVEKPFSRKYETILATTKSSRKAVWHSGMSSTDWYTFRGTILWTFQQHGISDFFIPNPPLAAGAPIVEVECLAGEVPINVLAMTAASMAGKRNAEIDLNNQIQGTVVATLEPGDELDRKLMEMDIRHMERMAAITEQETTILKEFQGREKYRLEVRKDYEDKLKECAVAISKCFDEQFLRDYEALIQTKQFRRFFVEVEAFNINKNVGQTGVVQAYQQIQFIRFNRDTLFMDSMIHFDSLLHKHEGAGGAMNDETKKYYLYGSLRSSNYPATFLSSLETLVNQDKVADIAVKLSYENFVNRVKLLYSESELEDQMDAYIGHSSSAGSKDRIATIKHSNKASKTASRPDVICFGCGKKGHFKNKCPAAKTTSVEEEPDTSLVNEFDKTISSKSKGK